MKEEYTLLELEIVFFRNEDIVTASGGGTAPETPDVDPFD